MRFIMALMLVLGSLTAAAAQALQPGDTIDVSVWQDSKLDRRVLIGPSGMISFPLAGHVRAGGLTPQALEDVLRNRLQKNYTDRLDITVSLASEARDDEDRKARFYVTGEISRPGPYVLTRRTNIMQAIATAGGLGIFAAKHRIQIRRVIKGVESIHLFDYNAFESGADTTGNIDLKSGDVIIVPERGLFSW
jgi:polysaccharide export outer membrane protein